MPGGAKEGTVARVLRVSESSQGIDASSHAGVVGREGSVYHRVTFAPGELEVRGARALAADLRRRGAERAGHVVAERRGIGKALALLEARQPHERARRVGVLDERFAARPQQADVVG